MNNKNIFLLINIILFVIFVIINVLQPLITDDLNRLSISALSKHIFWSNIVTDYFRWTGRVTAQMLVYLFFNKGSEWLIIVLNTINAFFMVLFYNLIFLITNNKNRKIKHYLSFILIFTTLLGISGFFKTMIWKTTALQYFWGILLLVFLYYDNFYKEKPYLNNNIIIFILGLIIGNYNEIFFCDIFILISSYLLYNYLFKINIKSSLIDKLKIFFWGSLSGGVILLIAPGNYQRKIIADNGQYKTFLAHIFDLYYSLRNVYIFDLFFLIIIFIIIFNFIKNKDKNYWKIPFKVFTLFSMILIYLPISNYGFADRMLIFPLLVFFILFLQFTFSNIIFIKIIDNTKFFILQLIVIFILFLAILNVYYQLYVFNKERLLILKNYKNQHIKQIKLESYKNNTILFNFFVYFDDITTDKNNWRNQYFIRYYDLKDVEIKD